MTNHVLLEESVWLNKVKNEFDDEDLKKFLLEGQKLMGQINRFYKKKDHNSAEYIRYQKILFWMIRAYLKIEDYRSKIYFRILEKQTFTETENSTFEI